MTKAKNSRDLKLFLILAVALGAFLFYRFLIGPKIQEISELKQDVEIQDQEIRNMYNDILKYENDAPKLQEARDKTAEKIDEFYVRELQETYFDYLNKIFGDCNITFSRIQPCK